MAQPPAPLQRTPSPESHRSWREHSKPAKRAVDPYLPCLCQSRAPLLDRGRERYDIFCSVCHGATGTGLGMIVRRGFPQPPSLHEPRLREAPAGHFFEVITHGYGLMYPYDSRIPVEDRWAIVAYIRALQFSQHATLADAAPPDRARLGSAKP